MIRQRKPLWVLAAGLAMLAGYVDAIGFLRLGGLFVSFMSGNSTRLAVGAVTDPRIALTAARLLAGFVGGVMIGTLLAHIAGRHRQPVLLAFVGCILAVAGAGDDRLPVALTTTALTIAMGAANTAFQRDGEVSIGVTYMTGTLVKFGQRLAGALIGGPRWAWLPYLLLWCGLMAGAITGAIAYSRFGMHAIAAAAAVAWLLAVYARCIDRDEPAR